MADLNAQRVLVDFLSSTLAERRERVVGFASSPNRKTQLKVLSLVYHELEELINPKAVVSSLPDSAWSSTAYLFCPPREFGASISSLTEALEVDAGDSERLAITQDGRFGCIRTEMSGDILVRVPNSRAT